ncbi:MAG TPA: hypothetical protein VJY62_04380, partial [Bacteroidia bacterium]|nr:hypothetical protein [Bacteroidia bacterium]
LVSSMYFDSTIYFRFKTIALTKDYKTSINLLLDDYYRVIDFYFRKNMLDSALLFHSQLINKMDVFPVNVFMDTVDIDREYFVQSFLLLINNKLDDVDELNKKWNKIYSESLQNMTSQILVEILKGNEKVDEKFSRINSAIAKNKYNYSIDLHQTSFFIEKIIETNKQSLGAGIKKELIAFRSNLEYLNRKHQNY